MTYLLVTELFNTNLDRDLYEVSNITNTRDSGWGL